jgi:hypothetical protein
MGVVQLQSSPFTSGMHAQPDAERDQAIPSNRGGRKPPWARLKARGEMRKEKQGAGE